MKIWLVSIIFLLTTISAYSSEKLNSTPIKPIFGIINSSTAYFGKSLLEKSCSIEGYNTLTNDTGVVIIGVTECDYSNANMIFYEIAQKGKKYLVEASKVKVDDADLARLKSLTEAELEGYRKDALLATKGLWLRKAEKAYDTLEKTKKYGVTILGASIYDVSEYTDGTGFRIIFYNPTKKTIKYLTTNIVGFNSVNDKVKDIRKKTSQMTVKGVGPLEPGASGSFEYDYVWFTDLVEYFKIISIKVQYMDGTSIMVKNPNKAWLDSETYETLKDFDKEDPDDVTSSAAR